MRNLLPFLALLLVFPGVVRAKERVYLAPSAFVKSAFGGKIPPASALALSPAARGRAKGILRHDYGQARVRYWESGARRVWILEEIGKTQPITTGFMIDKGRISTVRILIYRESHGWEVAKPFFTNQFQNASLARGDRLSTEVRNVAGATLSVRAVTKLARLALYFDSLL